MDEVIDEPEKPATRRLSQEELQDLLEREKARMTDPNYRNTLVPPPDDLLQALKRQAEG